MNFESTTCFPEFELNLEKPVSFEQYIHRGIILNIHSYFLIHIIQSKITLFITDTKI